MPPKKPTASQPPASTIMEAGLSSDSMHRLLQAVSTGKISPQTALAQMQVAPFEELGFASLDHHRGLRKLFPEVIYCAGKTAAQCAAIIHRLAARSPRVLGTRATLAQFQAARRKTPGLHYHPAARAIWLDRAPRPAPASGTAVVAAGTSDLPVAEEAALTLQLMGHNPLRIYDVGVAGIHRLIAHLPALRRCRAVVAVAGMEGALPSVLGGLIAAPIIAVPTSIGYGAHLGGIAALLAMLNSCAPGVSVVNIDNGFGAGYQAAAINRGPQEDLP